MVKCVVCRKNEASIGSVCSRCDPNTPGRTTSGLSEDTPLANDIQYAARSIHGIVNRLGDLREYKRLPEEERNAITDAVLSVESLLGSVVDMLLARDYLKGNPEPAMKPEHDTSWRKSVYGSGGGSTQVNRPAPRPRPPEKPKTTDAAHPWREQGF